MCISVVLIFFGIASMKSTFWTFESYVDLFILNFEVGKKWIWIQDFSLLHPQFLFLMKNVRKFHSPLFIASSCTANLQLLTLKKHLMMMYNNKKFTLSRACSNPNNNCLFFYRFVNLWNVIVIKNEVKSVRYNLIQKSYT